MDKFKEAFDSLVATYGEKEVLDAVKELELTAEKEIPARFVAILNPDRLLKTVNSLEASLYDIDEVGRGREAAYHDRAGLKREAENLETARKLTEANAMMMNVRNLTDKTAVGTVIKEDGSKVDMSLNNGEQRDAFRRLSSAKERKRLAEVNGELAYTDVELAQTKDRWERTMAQYEAVKAIANVQAALLTFLSGRK
jgi:hypothetical protein